MKGGGGVYPGKRRWKCLVIGVLFLVVFSMLVPLVFLLGLYNGFHSSGYVSDRSSSSSDSGSNGARADHSNSLTHYKRDQSKIREIIDHFGPTLPNLEDALRNHTNEARNVSSTTDVKHDGQQQQKGLLELIFLKCCLDNCCPSVGNNDKAGAAEVIESTKNVVEDTENLCELRFGSYCKWREEHREDMKDSMIKKLKDQLFVARAYFPSIAKLPAQNKLSQELKQNIQEFERILSESTTDTDLPSQIEKKLQKMELATAKARTFPVECHNVDKKLRQILDMTEDEANFHMRQSAFLYQLAVQTMPKSLHCLSMKLTVEYFNSSLHDMRPSPSEKFSDPTLHHYVIFSNNILASSVVINSTVTHTRDSGNLVFHVLTDEQNYFAMKLWFFRNTYREASIQVLNIEHLDLDYHDKAALLSMFLPVEFHVSFLGVDSPSATHLKTEYISVFSHAHYLLPYIFQNLKKVVVLDDDVVVQRDLSDLWNLNMGGKVNGALQLCSVRLSQLSSYLGENSFDKNSCVWMSGLNVIDLARWRELDLTETYRKLGQQVSKLIESIEASALSASLLTFQDQIYALDNVWALSGMGYDYGLDVKVIKNAAILHYNGKMKPWLELGIPKYRRYWSSFLNRDDHFLGECNVN
ncbi:probable galacturonosyltransferase 7 [Hevea brasiliensis]|uniref:probable galacturonosyltransferase 7 n=1 Tax=Hevea brasiliensis TaxID=3981 RepID=UPI0025E57E04|nr:probable galacturonosyltransferase 7 [Hevea brasiliensis]